ncbi:alternative oxidase [Vibrio chagasii]|nr:alternative oxidase [Vibrio chagasii]
MIFLTVTKPSIIERILVMLLQGFVFLIIYGVIYLVSSKTAHRIVGYFEEEACNSYSRVHIQNRRGGSAQPPAPEIAITYYRLPEKARHS